MTFQRSKSVKTILLIVLSAIVCYLSAEVVLLKQQTLLLQMVQIGKPIDVVFLARKPLLTTPAKDVSNWYGLAEPDPSGEMAVFQFFGGNYCYVSVNPDGTILDYCWIRT